jgi:flavin-dependent dehydrogenase
MLDQAAEHRMERLPGTGGRQTPYGLDMGWRLHPSCAGPGYFLMGDAAALLDPASSNGVLRALMSGMFAAHLAACVIAGKDEETALQTYVQWIGALYKHHMEILGDLYRRMDHEQVGKQYIQKTGEKATSEQPLL